MTLFLVTCLIYTTYSYTYCYFSHQSYGPLFDFVLLRLKENIWVQLLLLFFFLSELIAITRTSEYRLSLMEGQWFSGYLCFHYHYILKWNIVENLLSVMKKKTWVMSLFPLYDMCLLFLKKTLPWWHQNFVVHECNMEILHCNRIKLDTIDYGM